MSAHPTFSDELLHAYIDNELDARTAVQIRLAMQDDAELHTRVDALLRTRELMRMAFACAAPPRARPVPVVRKHARALYGMVASLLVLALCFGAGVLGYRAAPLLEQGFAPLASAASPPGLVLHIGESDPERFTATLAYAEHFLGEHADADVRVEVVANAGGLDLLRLGGSPHERQVLELMQRHENLRFVACMNTLRKLRSEGQVPTLIPDVRTDQTAVEHIVERVLQGWTYVKVEQLPGI